MRTFWKSYEIVYILSLDITARLTSLTGQLNKVPGSVSGKQRTPISGTQLVRAITFKLPDQMIPNLNFSQFIKFTTSLIKTSLPEN